VTRLGYGAMQLPGPGIWGPAQDRDAAIAVLRRAVDLGVTHIDTSHAYGPQVANQLLREALHPYPADLVVATKVGVVRDQRRAFMAAAKPAELRDQVEHNLRGLGVDRLELVYLRVGGDGLLVPDDVPLVESLGALADLQGQGLIGHPPGPRQQRSTLVAVARRHGATWAQVALAWLLARSPVMLAIPGIRSVAHLEENVAAARVSLSEIDLAELDKLSDAGA
jgi:aryl-alcohol dehydrogenase-like predicted oxidoreductase